VPGHGLGAATNDVLAQPMVIRAPSRRHVCDSQNHPGKFPCTSKNRNDIEGAAVANTKLIMSASPARQAAQGGFAVDAAMS